jgi:hypothetical protein
VVQLQAVHRDVDDGKRCGDGVLERGGRGSTGRGHADTGAAEERIERGVHDDCRVTQLLR